MKLQKALALVALMTSTAFAAFQAPLPEFKNEKQLAEWRAEQSSKPTSQGYQAEEGAFYTGKPYLASSGGYAFKYRSYDPELARWTSEDPSGFPDGANGNSYAPNPISSFDYSGLSSVKIYETYQLIITNTYTLGQAMLDVGLAPWRIPFVADAAFAKFQNDIEIRYPTGDQRTVGQQTATQWGEKEKPVLIGTNSRISGTNFEKIPDYLDYIFKATIYSVKEYTYE